jgi:hypothetical protein
MTNDEGIGLAADRPRVRRTTREILHPTDAGFRMTSREMVFPYKAFLETFRRALWDAPICVAS